MQNSMPRGKDRSHIRFLKQLERRGEYNDAKNLPLFSEETFKEHLQKIMKERFEGNPGRMQQLFELVEVKEKSQGKIQWWQDLMAAYPDDNEIQKELNKMRDSAPWAGCNKVKTHENDTPESRRRHFQ